MYDSTDVNASVTEKGPNTVVGKEKIRQENTIKNVNAPKPKARSAGHR